MIYFIPAIPFKVRKALKNASVKDIEWDMYDAENEKWFGYCKFGVCDQRIALTVCLVTGKACVELLAPLFQDDVPL
jgi:hypothetical protein